MAELAADHSARTLRSASVLSCAYFAAIGLFNPYAPLWYQSLGMPVVAIGFLVSLQSWTRLFAPYAWGALADRSGRRVALIRLATLLTFIAGLGFLLPAQAATLAVSTFLMFAFNAAVVPLTETVVAAQLVTESGGMDARKYGHVRVWGSVGFLISVLLAGWWFQHFGMGLFAGTVLVLLALVVLAAFRLPQRQVQPSAHEDTPPLASVMRRPEVRWFFAGVFLTVLAHCSVYAFFSLYLDSLGHSKPVVGVLWGVSVVVEIAWFTFQGRVLERGSLHRWLLAAALLSALRFGVTAGLGASLLALVLAQCLHALTFAAQHTACIALVSRYFPGRLRGRGQALYSVLGYGFSGVLGSVGGGWMASAWGYSSVFWAGMVAALLAAACCWRSEQLDPA